MENKKLFKVAYDKAAKIPPGGRNPLSEEEYKELLRHLYREKFKVIDCRVCGRKTQDKKRPNLTQDIRICGICLYNKN